jgi:hypothetical protein
MFRSHIVVAILTILCSQLAIAADGNVKGKVLDLQSGEPLIGANVIIVGSARGGVTNDKGEYFVSGIPPGVYTIKVSFIGYQTMEIKKSVESNETAVIDFKLASSDIPVEGVTVIGQAPLVDVMKTAGDQSFGREKIEQLPNVKDVKDVVPLQAGVVQFGGQLFLRGGRANETQILIDGVPVNDVSGRVGTAGTSTANEQLQQLYSGNVSAGAGGALSVSANAIQSVSITSSGLDAEYGNAQSGIISIVTREGGDSYSASVQHRTDGVMKAGQNERYYAVNFGGPEPITSQLLPLLGIKVGKTSFFLSGTFDQSDGPHDFNRSQFYNPVERKIRVGGIFGNLLSGLGFTYLDRQRNEFSFNSKITHTLGEADQLAFSYRANGKSTHSLSDSYSWRELSDSTTSEVSLVTQNVIHWSHIFGSNSLLKGFLSRLETNRLTAVGNLTPRQYSPMTNINRRDINNDGFNDLGTAQFWSTSNLAVWNLKFDYSSQLHDYHFLKAGIDYNYEAYSSTTIYFPQDRGDSALHALSFRGEYPGIGDYRAVTTVYPSRGALYVQDNIELSSINIHVGLRYDFFYLGKQVADPAFVKRYEELVSSGGRPYEYADWVDYNSNYTSFNERWFLKQFVRGNFSPRLSIGYPISTRTVFYFNYGHFLQYPERDQYFRDPVDIGTKVSNNYVGNPSLKPQKTVQYEAGFDQLIFDDLSLGIRGFYKDIFDYVTLKTRGEYVDRYINLDYASTRGFEIILTKQLTDRYSGSLTYTFSLAKGRSSDPFAVQASPSLAGLPREVRLDWDQEHTLNLFAAYRVGANEDYEIFGLPFNNWGASITWSFGSGFPYTPIDTTVITNSLQELYLKNTGTSPYTSEINMSLFKGFVFLEKLNVALTLDITNLLNRRNVNLNAGGFNGFTGAPIVYGDFDPRERNQIYSWGPRAGQESFDSRVSPFVFKRPRQISLGMKISWD